MPIDADKLKQILRRLVTELKNAEIRLQAYEMKLDGLNHAYPEENIVQSVQELLNNPVLSRDIHAKHDARLDTLLTSIDKAVADQDLDRILQDWLREHPDNPKH